VKRKISIGLIGLLLLTVSFATAPALAQDGTNDRPEWDYDGDEGPDHWGDLSADYFLCATGERQSPVDLNNPSIVAAPAIQFDYAASALHILNNGHTIQVNVDPGSSITVNGVQYDLVQFHFHAPSERTINLEHFAMELHLVHQTAEGRLAVVAVLIKAGDHNDAFAPIWEHAPVAIADEAQTIEGVTIQPADLLPDRFGMFAYAGSLTTPPCSENVQWLVLTSSVALSAAQIETFTTTWYAGNNRPVQPLNRRNVAVLVE
jgi:carbonic anhydrase